VIDGWSVGILLEELGELYSASVSGRPSALPPAVQYRDFAAWQNERLESELVSRELEYWRRQLDGVRSLRLPTDHPRPPRPSNDGRHHSFKLSPQALAALERLAREAGMTLHMLVVAAVGTLLHRYSGQDDFCIGIPKATRPQSRFERVLGFFINTLVLRLRLEDDPSFEELLARVRRSALEAYDHATVPFEWIVDDQHATRDLARTPFFDVMVTTREGRPVELVLPGLVVTPERIDSGVTQFDLTFAFERLRAGLSCGITYRAELFDPPTLERYESDFLTLFSVVASSPKIRPSELPVVETRERDRASTSTPAPRELVLADAPVRSGAAGLGGGAPPAVATFELEETIAAIWADVLEFESVGLHDNFFDLGGNSLLLIDAYSRLREVVGRELKVIDLFEHPTVSALARHLAQASKT
jgi:aryl carrier-like protein